MRRRVSVFGATGSIGQTTVSLIAAQGGAEAYDVVALTGAGNVALLAEQARALDADMAVTADETRLEDLRAALAGSRTRPAAGRAALLEAASAEVDWVMSAIVGAAGLEPGLCAARSGATIALANKESLVCAGELFLATCRAHGARLIPVDSEHSALHQAMIGEDRAALDRLILTASGGPFRERSLEEMRDVTPQEASAHPNWDMGLRISIDSASMFNKALEVIEAAVLFGARADQIEVLVHPQSIVHSLVGLCDGAVMAHMGPPDMRGAIGFALNWPERRALPVARLDLAALGRLDFAAVDPDRFPAVRLAFEALRTGGLAGAVLNAAKEVALDRFIAGDIGFLDMSALVEDGMTRLAREAGAVAPGYDLAAVRAVDEAARAGARAWRQR